MDLNNYWGTDIETFPDTFTCTLTNIGSGYEIVYEISDRRDDSELFHQMLYWMSQNHQIMVGFNNVGFDYVVLHHFMLNPNCGCDGLYQKAMSVISSNDRFSNRIWDNEVFIKQLDLYLIHHFDNMAKSTSLKMLEFCMRSETIEDLPYPVGTHLDSAQKDVLIKYNKKDVRETINFFHHSIKMVEFREELSQRYNKNFTNHNDTKIGKDYFIMKLEESIPGSCYDYSSGRRVVRQTFRPYIQLLDCIFPYVEFKRPEFQGVLDWLKQQRITETKGVFNAITVQSGLAQYMNTELIRVKGLTQSDRGSLNVKHKRPLLRLSDCPTLIDSLHMYPNAQLVSGDEKTAGLNCIIDGFQFDFGTGGIHGSVDSTIAYSDNNGLSYDEIKKIEVMKKIDCHYPSSEVLSQIGNEFLEFANSYFQYKNGEQQYV